MDMVDTENGNPDSQRVKLLGYSERGMINAMVHDLQKSNRCAEHLLAVLSLVRPRLDLPSYITGIAFLVEQSFSEFGDADLVILFRDEKGTSYSAFIEAKVACGKSWDLEAQAYSVFKQKIELNSTEQSKQSTAHKVNNSDLFTQLYFKS
jgi:hypothetical protein